MIRLAIALIVGLSALPIYPCSEDGPTTKQYPSEYSQDDLKDFKYVPPGFYTFSCCLFKQPIITGPCSPCVALFVSDPLTEHTLGFHITHNNCLKSMITVIDTYFPAKDNIKPNLVVTQFTHAHSELHKDFVFSEGSHKSRFIAIFNTLNANYNLSNYRLYFNDINSEDHPGDRWVMFRGLLDKGKPWVSRVNYRWTPGLDFARANKIIILRQLGSIKKNRNYNKFHQDEPLRKIEHNTGENIKSLPQLVMVPVEDGVLLDAFLGEFHLHMPMSFLGKMASDWITQETPSKLTTHMETFVRENRDKLEAHDEGDGGNTVISILKNEILSLFEKTDNGFVLKKF